MSNKKRISTLIFVVIFLVDFFIFYIAQNYIDGIFAKTFVYAAVVFVSVVLIKILLNKKIEKPAVMTASIATVVFAGSFLACSLL